jgi:hypothetical protein
MYDLFKRLFNTQSMKVAFILTFVVCYGWAQSTVGDIAFIAANADGGDDFAFVALVDITASAEIYFTDNEWNGSGFDDTNEGELTWTNAASTLSAGSVVVFTDPSSGGAVSVGSLSGSGWNLGASGEWWYALLEAPATSYGSAPTFLAAMANNAGAGWLTNTGLTEGTHAIDFNDDNDGYEYTGARTGQSSFSDYLAIIYNSSNWQIETSNGELILPISTTAFTISGAVKGEPTNHPTDFSASSSYQSIEITWTDAAIGSQAPDGYLILGESDVTITNPSDGTAVSDDTDATGNAVAKNITHGSGATYTFSSLTASTTWYFEIFSYTNSGSDIDYKLDGTIQTTNAMTGVAPVFVINEILADPDATNGDANGDGVVSTTDDEFVEIVNRSGYSVDISNWVIADGNGDRHTVTDGTTIGDGVALVVFGGGTPTGISGIAQTASTGALGLNNTGDDVTLKDTEGITIVTYSYGSTAGDNQSIARNPDYTGDFVKHSTILGNPELFSPGKTNASDTSLPVELSSFAASSTRSNQITLTWVTESEFENLGFLVERRNVDAESSWNEIASYISYPELQGQGSVSHRTEYTFTDNTVEMDQAYDYRLADVSFKGVKEYHEIHVLDVSPITAPTKFQLLQNYPNPFNPTTTISYDLPERSLVILTVFDIRGQEVATLQEEERPPGNYEVQWNGLDGQGNPVSTGVYFCRLQAGDFSQTIKMVYLR